MMTHDLSTAARFRRSDRVMYLGRIVEEGPARGRDRDPQHPYTKALLSVVPRGILEIGQSRDPQGRDAESDRGSSRLSLPSAVSRRDRRGRETDPELRAVSRRARAIGRPASSASRVLRKRRGIVRSKWRSRWPKPSGRPRTRRPRRRRGTPRRGADPRCASVTTRPQASGSVPRSRLAQALPGSTVETPTCPRSALRCATRTVVVEAVARHEPGLRAEDVALDAPDGGRLPSSAVRVRAGPTEVGANTGAPRRAGRRAPAARARRSRVRPRVSRRVGGGQVFGHSEPASASRTCGRARRPTRSPRARAHRGRLAGIERLGSTVAVSVGEVEQPSGDESRRAVGKDVAEPRREVRDRSGEVTRQPQPRVAEDLELGVERLPVVGSERASSSRWSSGCPHGRRPGAGDPGGGADVAANRDPSCPAPSAREVEQRAGARAARPARCANRRASGEIGLRRVERRTKTGSAGRRRLRCARREPAAEPADQLRDEVDVRPGQRRRCRHVAHGPISSRFGHRQRLERAEGVVAVAVGPAGHEHRRALDPVVAGPDRALPPVRPVVLLLEPAEKPRLGPFDAPRHSSRQPSP